MIKNCRYCKREVEAVVIETPQFKHYAKTVCPICKRQIDWLPKPENEGQRTKASKYTPEKIGIEYCELCGRTREKIGNNESLEIHHKIPINEGGKDIRENVLVLCTPCHRMAHFLRTYLHHHLDNFYSFMRPNGKQAA